MENQSFIKGNKNIVVQDVKDSNINVNRTASRISKGKRYTLIGLVIAVLTLLATVIIGWDNILKFFQK